MSELPKKRIFRKPKDIRKEVLQNCLSPFRMTFRILAEKLDVTEDTVRRTVQWLKAKKVLEENPDWHEKATGIHPRWRLVGGQEGHFVDPMSIPLPAVTPGDGLPGYGMGGNNSKNHLRPLAESNGQSALSIPADLIPADGIITAEVELKILTWLAAAAPSDSVKRAALADLRSIRQNTVGGVGPPDPTNDVEQLQRLVAVLDCAEPSMIKQALAILEARRAKESNTAAEGGSVPSDGLSDLGGRELQPIGRSEPVEPQGV